MKLQLKDGWKLRETPLSWDRDALWKVMELSDGWMDCSLPCDVHMPLEENGIIRDVVLADYSFDAEWTQERAWWFVKRFEAPREIAREDVAELVLTSLDARADVFLNGEWLGEHQSAHYPFVALVSERLKPGENLLAVRLTSGLERVCDDDLAQLNWAVSSEKRQGCPDRGDIRRAYVRKPQYTAGWDWAPKAVTCGIVGEACIRIFRGIAIRGVHCATLEAREGGDARLRVNVELESLELIASRSADVSVRISREGAQEAVCVLRDQLLTAGLNYFEAQVILPGAQLWWPNGYGAQPLYTVSVTAVCEGETQLYPPFEIGIRTIKMDMSRCGDGLRRFAFVVNDVPIFCKGADWVPADSIYARIDADKYRALVGEARAANMNMLRIWGGGLYEADAFYEACDRQGILLWHDFMLACSTYPDHMPWFCDLVEKEMDYQTRRLRNHPCMALWCGNNENHGIMDGRFEQNAEFPVPDLSYAKPYGLGLSNVLGRKIVRRNCPEIPYWNSSPYGGETANSLETGDVHLWVLMMNQDMKRRIEPFEYDWARTRFVSEYGYPGACSGESILRYFDGAEIDRRGKIWNLHNNTFEKATCAAGIEKHYGLRAEDLPLDQYVVYSQMVQMTMLGYSVESFRFDPNCSGALFWMFSDAWGEVGWSVVDYYLRRKAAFYALMRACAPMKLTLRMGEGEQVCLQGINDTDRDVRLERVWFGYVPLDGSAGTVQSMALTIPARSRGLLAKIDLPQADYTRGVFAVYGGGPDVQSCVLRRFDAREMHYAPGSVQVLEERVQGDCVRYTLGARVYLHGVYTRDCARCSDNYFDLLPGEQREVLVYGGERVAWHALNPLS